MVSRCFSQRKEEAMFQLICHFKMLLLSEVLLINSFTSQQIDTCITVDEFHSFSSCQVQNEVRELWRRLLYGPLNVISVTPIGTLLGTLFTLLIK